MIGDSVKIIFMGTPYFASRILQAIHNGGFCISALITQPDKESGRGQKVTESDTKKIANQLGIPILQPANKNELTKLVNEIKPGLIITAAYGVILPKEVLDIPKFGALNIHPSLLPHYRGATPISSAILNGDPKTGITVIKMNEKMDEGPMIFKSEIEIDAIDTTETLTVKLADLAAEEIVKLIPRWITGDVFEVPQNNDRATYCNVTTKEDGKIDWNKPAVVIERMIRAYDPWPGTFTFWNGKMLKILKAEVYKDLVNASGKIKILDKNLLVGTGSTCLNVVELQLEGKNKMTAFEFINGYKEIENSVLG